LKHDDHPFLLNTTDHEGLGLQREGVSLLPASV
jgi:hypothetical protein